MISNCVHSGAKGHHLLTHAGELVSRHKVNMGKIDSKYRMQFDSVCMWKLHSVLRTLSRSARDMLYMKTLADVGLIESLISSM